MKKEENRKVR